MHHVDPAGSAVQRNQLARFVFGIDDEAVGLVDHLLFADRSQRWLGCVPVGQRGVLHRGQGVCGRCTSGTAQRSWPASRPDRTASSGMHDVVVARLVVGLGAQHARR